VPELQILNIIFTSIMNLRFFGHDNQISKSANSATGDITKDAVGGTHSSVYNVSLPNLSCVIPTIILVKRNGKYLLSNSHAAIKQTQHDFKE
jgi:hypothetical protein